MAEFDYDFYVIGGGSGGVRAARFAAARYGARVGLAEEGRMGGTCVNVGCIPKKLFASAAHFAEDFEDAAGFGWTVGPRSFDMASLVANKDKEIGRLNGIYERVLTGAGVEVHHARARVVDPHTVEVGARRVTAKYILVATGGWPVVPELPGREHAITSNEAFYLPTLPKRVAVVGGGYIAVEFAGIFAGMGATTTQIYRGPLFLRGFDDDVRRHLAEEMGKKHVELRFSTDVTKIGKGPAGLTLTLGDGSTLEVDQVMYATGRAPNSRGIGLEEAGVKLAGNGAVVVDDHFRTSVASIYAIGDVIDRIQLTPVALAEGMAVTRTLFGGVPTTADYTNVPTAVFSHPNIGTVGLTEAAARARHGKLRIYRSTFTPLRHTLSGRPEKTLMKLVVEDSTDQVLGVHMVGPEAGEIVQGLAVAIKAGATKAVFDATIGIHPTAAEEFVTMREPVAEPAPLPAAAQ